LTNQTITTVILDELINLWLGNFKVKKPQTVLVKGRPKRVKTLTRIHKLSLIADG